MKRVIWVAIIAAPLLGLLAFGLRQNPDAVASPLLGKPAPAFAARTLDGQRISLSHLRGTPVVLNFWASWCAACRTEHPYLLRAWRQYGGQVRFLGVLFEDSAASAEDTMRQLGGGWSTMRDPDQSIAIGYGVAGPPETFFIDRHGVVRRKVVGPLTAAGLRLGIRTILEDR